MHSVRTERIRLLVQLERLLERPMFVLSFVWLALAVAEMTRRLSDRAAIAGTAIWIAFVAEFALKLIVAPDRIRFLRRNWLVAASLALPALRMFRVTRMLRAARFARGARLAKFLGAMNRGMRALRRTMRRHAFAYVFALTVLVLLAGSAAMATFERDTAGFQSYGDALWWTTMILLSIGTASWPETVEGRLLAVLLALYSLGVFGYITAILASYFIGEQRTVHDGSISANDRRVIPAPAHDRGAAFTPPAGRG